MLFMVTREYTRIGLDLKRGDWVELPAGVAEWVNRDSPGTLDPASIEAARAMEMPPEDRMMRQAVVRGEAELDGTPVPPKVVYAATKSGKKY